MKYVVDPFERLMNAVVVADVADEESELAVLEGGAHFLLLALVSTENPNLFYIGGEKPLEHLPPERSRAARNRNDFVGKHH
jgi:hypothetical protein